MRNAKTAFLWIIRILKKHRVPYQVTGGLAAKIYGAKRKLNDIDIDIRNDKFRDILADVKKYAVFGPARYKDKRWDFFRLILKYKGQKIDLSGAHNFKIRDARTGKWKSCPSDLLKSVWKNAFGIKISVVPKEDLVAYKKMLAGKHQIQDIREIARPH